MRQSPTRVSFSFARPVQYRAWTTCGFYYLYPRVIEGAMQEAYRQPSYYEGGACGYADTSETAQESALRATFKGLLNNLAARRLTSGTLLEVGCGYGYLLDGPGHILIVVLKRNFHQQGAEIAARQVRRYLLEASSRFPQNASSTASLRSR